MRPIIGAPLGAEDQRANQGSVSDLVTLINGFPQETLSGTIGLVGPWGSGKSSLAIATAFQLKEKHRWQTAVFEPWAYTDYPSMLDGFFLILRDQLGQQNLNNGARKKLQNFFQSIAPFGSIGSAIGIPLEGALSGISKLLSKRKDFITMRNEANEIFAELPHPNLVIIEDLDRLDSVELMNCFKLIRLLGDLKNVYYLLCYDEQTVIDVMQKTDVIGDNRSQRAYEYLEKIVNVRVDVLDLYGSEQKELWHSELREFQRRHNLTIDSRDSEMLDQLWEQTLSHYLRTPRSLSSFSLQLNSAWQSVAGEVHVADFIALTFLRSFARGVFDLIKRSKAELVTRSSKPNLEKLENWRTRLIELKIENSELLLPLLGQMFRQIGYDPDVRTLYIRSESRRIEQELYFDRYFRNSMSRDDIPECSYRAYLEDVAQGEYCDRSKVVLAELNVRNEQVWGRLEREIDPSADTSRHLFRDVQSQYALLTSVGGMTSRRDDFLLRCAIETLSFQDDRYHHLEWYREQSARFGGLAVAADIFQDAWHLRNHDPNADLNEFERKMLVFAKETIRGELLKDPSTADHAALRVLKVLIVLVDAQEIREFLTGEIESSSSWTVFDFMVGLLDVSIRHTADGPQFSVGPTSLKRDRVEHFIGFEWAAKELPEYTAVNNTYLEWSEERPSQDLLKNLVIEGMHRLSERRSSTNH